VKSIYQIPLKLHEQGLDREVCRRLHLETKEPDLRAWAGMVDKILHPPQQVRIAVVGKYTELADSYKSVHEALVHGGIANDTGVQIQWIASDRFTDQETAGELLAGYDGLLVPGGFGVRGIEGMLEAIRWSRERKLPFFGICLGLQTAIIEFARNVCKLTDTNSSEFAPECENPVIALMRSQEGIQEMGGTMRLGAYPCRLRPGSLVAQTYNSNGQRTTPPSLRSLECVSRRWRYGLRASGLSPDGSLVEMTGAPRGIPGSSPPVPSGLKSRPMRPHPPFVASWARARIQQAPAAPSRRGDGRAQTDGAAVRRGEQPVSHRAPRRESDDLNVRVGEALTELAVACIASSTKHPTTRPIAPA
jgi:CTP synthase